VAPEDAGGLGLGMLEAALASEALGAAVAPVAFMGVVLAPLALARGGSQAQRAEWLPKLASGELLAAAAISEPVAGARDGAGVTAKDGRLSGKALFVPGGMAAGLIVAADTAGSLHLVRGDAAGLTRSLMPGIDDTRRLAELTFSDTPAEPLGNSRELLGTLRDAAWILIAADTLGAAQTMLDKAVAYSKERKQFGRTIGSFQAVKHLCAEMAAELEPARALVWYAAYAWDLGLPDASRVAAHAKAHLADRFVSVARAAVQAHGGIGYTWEYDLQIWFRRSLFDRAYLGEPSLHRERAAALAGW